MSARFYADPIIAAALAEPDTAYLPQLERYNRQLAEQRAVVFDRPHRTCTCPDWAEGYGAGGKHGRFCDSLSQPYEPAYDEVVVDEGAMNAWLDSLSRDFDVDTESAA